MSRSITAINPQTNRPVVVTTSVTTWGELKPLLNSAGMSTDNMKAIIKATMTTLERSDAVLPEGDFKMFLFPEKVKSGIGSHEVEVVTADGLIMAMKNMQDKFNEGMQQFIDDLEDRVIETAVVKTDSDCGTECQEDIALGKKLMEESGF